ncbi:hypothetical protein AT746_01635 [Lacimicrobium alkaliphilum]|uniref:SnoaL-like domain-containing protein n=2 Tax=Lacimicrobium alkaliphilum TaxID=1526571 RepID=A0A0U2ZPQ0_9ALTE|nr:hypothetical protein AT746_01635 [Lacimicrobium alkaliphilum]
MVVDFYQLVFVKRQNVEEAAQRYLHPDYIQHNPYVATGRKAFTTAIGGWLSQRPATHKMEIKRVISSGDYVVLHVHEYDTSSDKPGKAGVDIFRVSEGKIIEHWDVWQDIPKTMPHNNGML